MARSENGARPARRPPGLDAHGHLEIISGKSDSMLLLVFAHRALVVDAKNAYRTRLTDNP
jgi:hypothetical protein